MKYTRSITRKYFGTLKGAYSTPTGWMKKYTEGKACMLRPVRDRSYNFQLVMWDELKEMPELQDFFAALAENSDEILGTPEESRWQRAHPIDHLYHLIVRTEKEGATYNAWRWSAPEYDDEPYYGVWLYDAVGNLNNIADFLTLEYAAQNIKRLNFEQVYIMEPDEALLSMLELLHES